eukprot:TRINITY_DN24711_c1_g1_i1.p1 TRINITY_DN24711_c1_g1~~TRINITY_DN24711_c1_g1_i1.p1  ORF type:complete len:106 (-),score=22.05 TRINITY_DN24711_c1_g1_i1:38-355(-)
MEDSQALDQKDDTAAIRPNNYGGEKTLINRSSLPLPTQPPHSLSQAPSLSWIPHSNSNSNSLPMCTQQPLQPITHSNAVQVSLSPSSSPSQPISFPLLSSLSHSL